MLRTERGDPYLGLVKMGHKEHLESLRTGLLYMRKLVSFAKDELDVERDDIYEGVSTMIQPTSIKQIRIIPGIDGYPPFEGDASSLAGPIKIRMNRDADLNVFCLYAITKPTNNAKFAEVCKEFGGSFVLITDTQEFIARVQTAATNQGLTGEGGLVEYFDEASLSGKVGPFRKRSKYSHQEEYRLVLETGQEGPFSFNVGNLADITSEVIFFDMVGEVLKFSYSDAVEAGLVQD